MFRRVLNLLNLTGVFSTSFLFSQPKPFFEEQQWHTIQITPQWPEVIIDIFDDSNPPEVSPCLV